LKQEHSGKKDKNRGLRKKIWGFAGRKRGSQGELKHERGKTNY